MHTYVYVCMYVFTHACMRVHMHVYAYVCSSCAYVCMYLAMLLIPDAYEASTYAHLATHTYKDIYAHTCVHNMNAYGFTYTNTHIHNTHTWSTTWLDSGLHTPSYIHTYTYVHVYIPGVPYRLILAFGWTPPLHRNDPVCVCVSE